MPSSTPRMAGLMAARAHGWRPAHPRGALPSVAVAREFNAADTGTATLREGMRQLARRRGSPRAEALRRRVEG